MEQIQSIGRSAPDVRLLALPACRHSPHRDQTQAVITAAKESVIDLAVAAEHRIL
jgi:hypothetical protein